MSALLKEAWRRNQARVEAYSPRAERWRTVAVARATPELDAEGVASVIVDAVNAQRVVDGIIDEAIVALQTCLECEEKLDFAAEREAEGSLQSLTAIAQREGRASARKARPGIEARMAATIATLRAVTGACASSQLIDHGFTPDEIDAHWAAASQAAEFQRRVSRR